MTELLGPRIDWRYCPHRPFPKQLTFLQIDDREALYGGAAGGGKSDALLMAFLQYADMPHYRGLILRRKKTDMVRADAILNRAKTWWLPTSRSGIQYLASEFKFIFPSGATCEFGHCQNVGDEEENYQGGAWQFIGFDEVCQLEPRQYLYLFSRNRSTVEEDGKPDIPLRMRCTANPGGVSHNFMRDRFMSLEYAREFLESRAADYYLQEFNTEYGPFRRWFVPAKSSDNFALNHDDYNQGLSQLDVVNRERLMRGDWLVAEQGVFRPEWFRRYRHPDHDGDGASTYKLLNPSGSIMMAVHQHDCYRFCTIDPAGTSRERKAQVAGKDPCFSTISVWDYTQQGFLIWRRVVRLQGEFPEVLAAIRQVYQEERPQGLWLEVDGVGRPYFQQLEAERFPVYQLTSGGKDKLTRAAPATNEAKEGRVFLPTYAPWKDSLEAELFAWQGTSEEVCDQIDTLAYAAMLKISGCLGGVIQLQ